MCGPDVDGATFKASIYSTGEETIGPEYLFIKVKNNKIDIEDNVFVGAHDDLEVDINFGIGIESAILLRDFLNYALPETKYPRR